jgi:dihydrodipicolinate synthase/N-acetylneuraminate lyase
VKLSPKELASLSKVGVKYLKDTSGDGPALTEMLFGLSDQITAFNSSDTLTFYGLAAGARGGIWGAANIIPELAVELWDTVAVKGDLKKGRELWARIWPICKFLESHNYAAAVKTGLELTGTATGGLRKPFHMLGPQVAEEMKVLIQNAGLKTV